MFCDSELDPFWYFETECISCCNEREFDDDIDMRVIGMDLLQCGCFGENSG